MILLLVRWWLMRAQVAKRQATPEGSALVLHLLVALHALHRRLLRACPLASGLVALSWLAALDHRLFGGHLGQASLIEAQTPKGRRVSCCVWL